MTGKLTQIEVGGVTVSLATEKLKTQADCGEENPQDCPHRKTGNVGFCDSDHCEFPGVTNAAGTLLSMTGFIPMAQRARCLPMQRASARKGK